MDYSNLSHIIYSINNNIPFVIHGNPSNEEEYKKQVKFIDSSNDTSEEVYFEEQPITWAEILSKKQQIDSIQELQDIDYQSLSPRIFIELIEKYK